jgi:ribonuclease BN (tRNA processing enzyme)
MKKVTLEVLGCGGAFSEDGYLYHSSYLLTVEDDHGVYRLIYDIGKDVFPWALKARGYKATDIDAVVVSHRHSDHIGSLGLFGLKRFDFINKPTHWSKRNSYCRAPILYIPKGLETDYWNTVEGDLATNEGFKGTLETFFQVISIDDSEIFDFHGVKLQLVAEMHVMITASFMPMNGLFIDLGDDKDKIFLTGDTQYFMPEQVRWFFDHASIIIADTETFGTNLKFQEGTKVYKATDDQYYEWPKDDMKSLELMASGILPESWKCYKFGSGVHAPYAKWAGYESANSMKLDPVTKLKIHPTHYGDHVPLNKDAFGNDVNWDEQAKKDGLGCFVKPGMKWEFNV